jgi:hypothetical protein
MQRRKESVTQRLNLKILKDKGYHVLKSIVFFRRLARSVTVYCLNYLPFFIPSGGDVLGSVAQSAM